MEAQQQETQARVSVEELSQLADSTDVSTTLRVTEKIKSTTKSGKDYLRLVFEDKTGTTKAVLWDNVDSYEGILEPGRVAFVYGRVGRYNGELQFTVLTVRPLNQDLVDMSEFRPCSKFEREKMLTIFDRLVSSIEDEDVKKLVRRAFAEDGIGEMFSLSPAAKGNHHAFVSGLIEHTISMCQLAISIADHYETYYPGMLNLSLLQAGVIFHDLGKIWELDADGTGYTTRGNLIGHIPMSFEFIAKMARAVGMDEKSETVMRIQHMVLSHHGRQEWGSPVEPRTVEAVVLHQLDMLDSRMNMLGGALEAKKDGEWTDYHRALGGPIFKGLEEREDG